MMRKIVYWLKTNEQGQGMLEYGLILMIVSVAFIVLLGVLGNGAKDTYSSINNTMP